MTAVKDNSKGTPISSPSLFYRLRHLSMPFIVCLLGALFFLYEFTIQIAPSIMTDELMRDLSITATELGIISAFFYYGYTAMQIPAGLLYDRYGPRLLMTVFASVCVIGAFCFSFAVTPWQASLGRLCMGIGGAFSFIGTLVLISRWFDAKYFALLSGVIMFIGSMGSMLGNKPLAYGVSLYGWRYSFLWMAFFGVALVACIWCFVRDYPADKAHLHASEPTAQGNVLADVMQRLRRVISKKQTWTIALFTMAIWAPILCFAGLWGVPFLKAKYGINDIEAAGFNMFVWLGIAVFSPLIGYLSNKLNNRQRPLYIASLVGLFCSLVIIYVPNIPNIAACLLLLGFGLASAGQSLAFAVVNDITERDLVGTAVGFNNMATVSGGAFLQPLIGKILDWHWDGTMVNGAPVYELSTYQAGLSIAPICYLLCFVLSFWFIKETHCQLQFPDNDIVSNDKEACANDTRDVSSVSITTQ